MKVDSRGVSAARGHGGAEFANVRTREGNGVFQCIVGDTLGDEGILSASLLRKDIDLGIHIVRIELHGTTKGRGESVPTTGSKSRIRNRNEIVR